MADIETPTAAQIAEHKQWVAERPEHVQKLAEQFSPWKLYRLSPTNSRVVVTGYDETENGGCTVRIAVLAKYNFVFFERSVFGVKPENLEECDLPGPDDKVGFSLGRKPTDEELSQHIEERRAKMQPDWN